MPNRVVGRWVILLGALALLALVYATLIGRYIFQWSHDTICTPSANPEMWQWCRYWNGQALEEALVVVTLAIVAWVMNNRRPLPRLHIPRWMTITGTAVLLALIYRHLIGTHGFGLVYKYACQPIYGLDWVACRTWRMQALLQSVAVAMVGSAAWIASRGRRAETVEEAR